MNDNNYIENKGNDSNSLFSKAEIRRLEKAAKEKNKMKLMEWGIQFENQVKENFEKEYDRALKEDLGNCIDTFCLAIAYTLHFNEKTKFGRDRLCDFLQDMFVTVDLFRKGEYNPEDYKKELEEYGIYFSDIKSIREKEYKINDENRFKGI